MHWNINEIFCPVCRQSVNQDSEALKVIEKTLLGLTLGRMLPAILHDMGHSIDAFQLSLARIQERQKVQLDPRTSETLARARYAAETLAELKSSLSRVCRIYEEHIWLRDLARVLQDIFKLYSLRNAPNLAPLNKSDKKVHGTYITVFSLLLQSVLINLGRSMRPRIKINFDLTGEKLHTNFSLRHEASFSLIVDEINILVAQVHLIDGEMIVDQDDSHADIKWTVPLLS